MKLSIETRFLELKEPISIANRTFDGMDIISVTLGSNGYTGRGECSPQKLYGQTTQGCIEQIMQLQREIESGNIDRQQLQRLLPACSARNALDCAFWDLETKIAASDIWSLSGIAVKDRLVVDVTIGLNSPEKMAMDARRLSHMSMLKLKLGDSDDMACLQAVRLAAPKSHLIIDVNEGWSFDQLQRYQPVLEACGVQMIEQPLPSTEDHQLANYTGSIPLCADESCHDRQSLDGIKGLYQYVNIKLDKTGGLTEAIALAKEAKKQGFRLMVGCMAGTSLAMAPAYVIGTLCEVVDLDVPLQLKNDIENAMHYEGTFINTFSADLWGHKSR
jgi:L-Ala-D/L-Glu epimerase / N-acetyl-D-glutamate racemase